MREPAGERGSVAAEFAVVLPAVLLVLAVCVGAASLSVQRIGVESAAAAAARIVARGDGSGSADAAVDRAIGRASLRLERSGAFVCAEVTALAGFTTARSLGVTVSGRSCALDGEVEP
jgi:Flp pilus assembly protein TadG